MFFTVSPLSSAGKVEENRIHLNQNLCNSFCPPENLLLALVNKEFFLVSGDPDVPIDHVQANKLIRRYWETSVGDLVRVELTSVPLNTIPAAKTICFQKQPWVYLRDPPFNSLEISSWLRGQIVGSQPLVVFSENIHHILYPLLREEEEDRLQRITQETEIAFC